MNTMTKTAEIDTARAAAISDSQLVPIELLSNAERFTDWALMKYQVKVTATGFSYVDDDGETKPLTDLTRLVYAALLRQRTSMEEAYQQAHQDYAKQRRNAIAQIMNEKNIEAEEAAKEYDETHRKPASSFHSQLKKLGITIANHLEIQTFADLYTSLHDEMYLKVLRERVVEHGDYEVELETFKSFFHFTDFEANAVAKWIQNTKRRILGQYSGNEFALILTGRQGTGKSYFAERLVSAMSDGYRKFDAGEIHDKDIVGAFGISAVIIFDEFKVTDRVGLEGLKRAITMKQYDYRPAYSALTKSINSIASFICSSNHRLSDLVRDVENRRFIEIDWDDRLPVTNEGITEYYSRVNWISFFNSVPIERDVWTAEDYDTKNTLTKTNVKADNLREYIVLNRDRVLSESIVFGDQRWIPTGLLQRGYNEHLKDRGERTHAESTIGIEAGALGMGEAKPKGKNRVRCYFIENLLQETADDTL